VESQQPIATLSGGSIVGTCSMCSVPTAYYKLIKLAELAAGVECSAVLFLGTQARTRKESSTFRICERIRQAQWQSPTRVACTPGPGPHLGSSARS
jgi:hypothetical protein